ncbi:HalOD1 output domain-containing protein [Natronorubrum texcoconense]|uniref:Halobacterial output domain-containing protein n=1 Tax=Natronorubrum texcoconense TaxID=1095776 RepID=A0A1G9B511_9EURY|nr:HalOD1 output domain-containing protein [Natronorubrum texcoconense]SDK34569.1 hypothetical protein SAMN04515672_2823 [Natronorubrum texcoconense]
MSATEPVTQQLSPADEVCTTVALAVSAATDTPVDELPPLYTVIDPDALNAIFQPRTGRAQNGTQLSFTIAGCAVSIRDDTVTVTANSETPSERAASGYARAN